MNTTEQALTYARKRVRAYRRFATAWGCVAFFNLWIGVWLDSWGNLVASLICAAAAFGDLGMARRWATTRDTLIAAKYEVKP